MESQGWWDAQAEEELKSRLKSDVMDAFKRAEKLSRWELGELFTDVYEGEQPWNIVRLPTPFIFPPDVVIERAAGRAC